MRSLVGLFLPLFCVVYIEYLKISNGLMPANLRADDAKRTAYRA